MKKALVILMLAAMAFTACSKNEEPETPTTEEVVEETVVEETQVSEEAEESVEFSYPKPENNPLGLDVYDAAGRELLAVPNPCLYGNFCRAGLTFILYCFCTQQVITEHFRRKARSFSFNRCQKQYEIE